jgi:hypothetical protein
MGNRMNFATKKIRLEKLPEKIIREYSETLWFWRT